MKVEASHPFLPMSLHIYLVLLPSVNPSEWAFGSDHKLCPRQLCSSGAALEVTDFYKTWISKDQRLPCLLLMLLAETVFTCVVRPAPLWKPLLKSVGHLMSLWTDINPMLLKDFVSSCQCDRPALSCGTTAQPPTGDASFPSFAFILFRQPTFCSLYSGSVLLPFKQS